MSMRLEDFRGIHHLELDLDGADVDVRGANGTGKTTILDAYLWCLTGKDSQGRTDCEIKRRVGKDLKEWALLPEWLTEEDELED